MHQHHNWLALVAFWIILFSSHASTNRTKSLVPLKKLKSNTNIEWKKVGNDKVPDEFPAKIWLSKQLIKVDSTEAMTQHKTASNLLGIDKSSLMNISKVTGQVPLKLSPAKRSANDRTFSPSNQGRNSQYPNNKDNHCLLNFQRLSSKRLKRNNKKIFISTTLSSLIIPKLKLNSIPAISDNSDNGTENSAVLKINNSHQRTVDEINLLNSTEKKCPKFKIIEATQNVSIDRIDSTGVSRISTETIPLRRSDLMSSIISTASLVQQPEFNGSSAITKEVVLASTKIYNRNSNFDTHEYRPSSTVKSKPELSDVISSAVDYDLYIKTWRNNAGTSGNETAVWTLRDKELSGMFDRSEAITTVGVRLFRNSVEPSMSRHEVTPRVTSLSTSHRQPSMTIREALDTTSDGASDTTNNFGTKVYRLLTPLIISNSSQSETDDYNKIGKIIPEFLFSNESFDRNITDELGTLLGDRLPHPTAENVHNDIRTLELENSTRLTLNQWPVKHSAVVEGDLVLGGLMMVHEREDTVTCGPVMPQGGVQALEAMLYTLDWLNEREIMPGVKIGAHILDDCDKDTYGLEMAVDFIKGKWIKKIKLEIDEKIYTKV